MGFRLNIKSFLSSLKLTVTCTIQNIFQHKKKDFYPSQLICLTLYWILIKINYTKMPTVFIRNAGCLGKGSLFGKWVNSDEWSLVTCNWWNVNDFCHCLVLRETKTRKGWTLNPSLVLRWSHTKTVHVIINLNLSKGKLCSLHYTVSYHCPQHIFLLS